MNLVQKLMGRRQFLMAAGAASACAITCKKLAGSEHRPAMKVEPAAAADAVASGSRCAHLLSPITIRNRVLKNRIMHCVSPVYTLQGPENFPTDAWRNHYSNLAKNAGIITMETCFGPYPKTYHTKAENFALWSWEHISNNKWQDIPPVYNYLERAIEDAHCEGTMILFGTNTGDVGDAVVAGDVSSESGKDGLGGRGIQGAADMSQSGAPTAPGGQGGAPGGGGPMGMGAQKSVEEIVADAKDKEEMGYDIYQMESGNLDAIKAVRNATNLLIISSLNTGTARSMGGSGNGTGNRPSADQLQQAVESARKVEGIVDILLMKGGGSAGASWESSKYEEGSAYYISKAIKKAGVKIAVAMGGGTHDPVINDGYIAEGAADIVCMTRPLFADYDLVKKVSSGLAEDVTPCVQCQNCHAESMSKGPHFARCTVNPKWATPIYKLKNIEAPLARKKVAVIGGGPAGMKAAVTAAERGHQVTLYEKEAALGGLQRYTDYSSWVWPYKKLKDWLILQVGKAGVDVKVNTAATGDMLKAKGYDTVLVATGADLIPTRMRGADAANVFDIMTGYSRKSKLGENVIFIGAGKFGTEAALSMALDGKNVTVLAPGEEMFDLIDIGPHNVTAQTNLYRSLPNFAYHMQCMPKSINGGKVTYTDSTGKDHTIEADSVVIWSGLKARTDDAAAFQGAAPEVILVGSCTGELNRLNRTIRGAFYAASRV